MSTTDGAFGRPRLPRERPRGIARRMPLGVVYVLAKAPRPGFVKTRLCPPLEAEQSCRLAGAFATDVLHRMARAGGFATRLALDETGRPDAPGPAGTDLRRLAGDLGVPVEDQGEGDLGARMQRILARGLATVGPTILVGTDSPDLPLSLVASAFDALERADVVIAPARDGGYVLIGARRVVPGLFAIDAPWSSERVFGATCEAIRRAGCAFEALGAWDDVDDAAALGRLATRLDGGGEAAAHATARLLEEWRRQGVRF